jgi:FAD:protein FMN transferase
MRQLLYILIVVCLLGCTAGKKITNESLRGVKFNGVAQGTTYQVTYYARDSIFTKKNFDSIFTSIDSSLSIYKPYSLISTFNEAPSSVEMDKHLRAVVEKSLLIYKQTSGMSDITVYPLVTAWGFGTTKISNTPDSATIQSILKCVGSDKIYIEGDRLVKKIPCVKIDVNGIAQGYTVDVIAGFLEKHNIYNYLVEVGGEIRVKGKKQPGNIPFSVGIESPAADTLDEPIVNRIVHLQQGAITTSGNYRRYYKSNGKIISHLVNPFTGYTVQNELISVTLFAPDAITADGYDNALMGMGLKTAFTFLEQHHNLEAHFIYHTATGAVADTATKGFYKLFSKSKPASSND